MAWTQPKKANRKKLKRKKIKKKQDKRRRTISPPQYKLLVFWCFPRGGNINREKKKHSEREEPMWDCSEGFFSLKAVASCFEASAV